MVEPKVLKGFRDFGAYEESSRQRMFKKISSSFELFGFAPLSTPALEYKEILLNKYGDEEKLVYSFKDNGDRDVAMRYDLTVPMARYVAMNQGSLMLPFKRYQIAPVWRAENTQRGRSREFYQCDVDIVGTNSQVADSEILACMAKTIESLGVEKFELRINDRRVFNNYFGTLGLSAAQIGSIIRGIDKLDKVGVDGVIEYLAKGEFSQTVLDKVREFLTGEDVFAGSVELKESIDNLINLVVAQGVDKNKVVFNPFIARGLEYYTSMVYEVVLSDAPQYGSVSGGGRYDGLLDQFSEKPLPAVGGSIGIDRLFEYLEDKNLLGTLQVGEVVVFNLDQALSADYQVIATSLRGAGISTEVYYDTAKLDKQFKYAEAKGALYAVIMGVEEKSNNEVKLKDLKNRTEQVVEITELADKLSELLKS